MALVRDIMLQKSSILSACVAVAALSSCSAYDSELLEQAGLLSVCGDGEVQANEFCDSARQAETSGACPTACSSDDACTPLVLVGTGCQRRCLAVHITTAESGDGCCPEQVSAGEDSDCGACGDEVIGPAESCDPPENCPTQAMCESRDQCIAAVFSGEADTCNARCELKPVTSCLDGDGCCPAGCAEASDDDCSGNCGDGRVDAESGETCEPDSRSAPCPTRCNDGDACTRDLLVGSAGNCNARCSHTAITEAASEDGCCPPGASSLSDTDCTPVCGNDVTEDGEECDFRELCSEACTRLMHSSLVHRYDFSGDGTRVHDSVGGADGEVVNAALTGEGEVVLAGGSSEQYVDLPNGLISGLTSASIETWLRWSGGSQWQRIFDFGNNSNGQTHQGGAATSFWFLTASDPTNMVGLYVNFSPNAGDTAGDRKAVGSGAISDGAWHQVVAVFDGEAASMHLYLDGSLQATRTGLLGGLGDIDDRNAWIGRSNWNDDELAARLTEFRIYQQALNAEDVQRSYQLGPDPRRAEAFVGTTR
jgi:hypothetical protein